MSKYVYFLIFTDIYLLSKNGSKLNYMVYNIGTNKVHQDYTLPTDAFSFISRTGEQKIQLQCFGEVC